MDWHKVLASLFSIALFAGVLTLPARAGDYSQRTKFEFNTPVEVSGKILPAGSYWFVLANDDTTRQIVKVFNGHSSKLCAIVYTVPVERSKATTNTVLKVAERAGNKPNAVLQWFYPGSTTGHAFVYPTSERHELATDAKLRITVHRSGNSSLGNEPSAGM